MEGFKTVKDRRYINNLFHTLARQKEIPVSVHMGIQNEMRYATLSFNNDNEPTMIMEDQAIRLHLNERAKVFFFFKESFFFFESEVTDFTNDAYRLKKPLALYSSCKRMMPRYKFVNNETAYLSFPEHSLEYRLYDLSIKGLSFISDAKLPIKDQIVRNITLKLEDHIELIVDIVIKHFRKNNSGQFIYGVAFLTVEWFTSHEIFSYIFEKSYADLKLLNTLTTAEIFKLYKESRYISLKSRNEQERPFIAQLRKLDSCNRNPILATGAVYFKDGKLLTIGSAFRVYNRSFVGQPFTTIPGVWLNSKGKIDLYIGMAEVTLHHPYMEFFFSYITKDLDWHRELFGNIHKVINDENLFNFEEIPRFDCSVPELQNIESTDGYSCDKLEDPDEFIEHCLKNPHKITPLECDCYKYKSEGFYLFDLKQFYQEMGFFIERKLWRVSKRSDGASAMALAYAITEVYSNGLSLNNELDICRFFLTGKYAGVDLIEILKALLPEITKFYQENGKETFILLFDSREQIKDINIPGLTSQATLGRIMMNREGLVECRKLLFLAGEFHGKYHHLTHPQKVIWYTEKVYPGTSIGNNAITIRANGDLDFVLLEEAVNVFLEKNDSIRLRIMEDDNEPMQYIADYHYYFPEIFDFSTSQGIDDFYQWEANITKLPFELINSDLFYFAFIRISAKETALYYKIHHTITDAWATTLMTNQIFKYYYQLKNGIPITDEKQPSYIEYITSEEEFEHSERLKQYKKYWNDKFKTVPEFIYIKNRHSGNFSTKAKRKGYLIGLSTAVNIRNFCKDQKESVFTLFISLISIYLSRIFMKDDLSIGTTILNRADVREKRTIGMFVNVIPIRLNVDNDLSFDSYLHLVGSEWKTVLKNQKYPYDLILKDFREKHKVQDELFDVSFTQHNAKYDIDQYIGDYKERWHTYGHQTNSLSIFLNDREGEGNYILNFDYLAAFFTDEEIEQIFNHLSVLLQDALKNPGKRIYQMEMLSEKEKAQILVEFNKTQTVYPKNKPIYLIFEEQVEKRPDNIALVFGDNKLTYRELNERSNQLARVLRCKGVKPDTFVGIMVDRSYEMIIGIMGILKAGGAYVPISPEYPEGRMDFILKDCNANILLTQTYFLNKLKFHIDVIDIQNNECYKGETSNLEKMNTPNDLIYVLFTSGSTGQPKGVMIEHQSVVNILLYLHHEYPFLEHDAFLLKTTFTFDVSVTELFGWFLGNGRLVILEKGAEKDPERILKSIQQNNITHINFAPSLLNVFVSSLKSEDISLLKSLKYIFVAGEAISKETVVKFYGLVKHIKLENLYGPTEATIYATKDSLMEELNVTIGKPVQNTSVFVVGKKNCLQPVGIPGELCISGDGLARGYLNRAGLTSEKFVSNPFSPGEFMYKTGDLVRWLPDGKIEYFGRLDFQVKIRGYRIELGEIEHQLLGNENIKEAVVIAKEDHARNKYLCAYFTADRELDLSELRTYLLNKLPDYMVPSFFIQLEKLPLSINGKVNRNALPEPNTMDIKNQYVAPRNKNEEILKNVWEKVLGIENIGITNTFFELGGDSIKAIQVASNLRKYGMSIELQDLLKNPTIAVLSSYVKFAGHRKLEEAVVGEFDLIPIQRWFFEQKFTDMHHFNQSLMLFNKNGFNEKYLIKVFTEIMRRHDALRMVFRSEGEKIIQINRDINEAQFDLNILDLTQHENFTEKISNETKKLNTGIDLTGGPLVKLGLFKTAKGDYLCIVIHHLVVDGISWRILLEDLAEGYVDALNEKNVKFQDKTHSFKEWSKRLQAYAINKNLIGELDYWKKVDQTPMMPIPKDFITKENKIKNSRDLELQLTRDETENLLQNVNKAYNTNINEILLTALGLALREWTGEEEFVIDMEGHGRENIIDGIDITRTVGWFTSLFPFLLDMTKSHDLSYQIKTIKEDCRQIPNKGIGYGILKYLTPDDIKNGYTFLMEPEICFNYLGQIDNIKTDIFNTSQISYSMLRSPNLERKYVFDINAMIVNGVLSIYFNYNINQFKEERVLEFIQLLKRELQKIISHCLSKGLTEYTPADFAVMDLTINEFDKIQTMYDHQIEKLYSLTPMQEGMLVHSLSEVSSKTYFEQLSFNLVGELDIVLFETVFTLLIQKYDIFRTVIVHQGIKSPKQIVLKERTSDLFFVDVSKTDQKNRESFIEDFKKSDRDKNFDLSRDFLIRISVIRINQTLYHVVFSFHHIIMDGWSLGLILKDLFSVYQSLNGNQSLKLPKTRPYAEYIEWLKKQDKEEASLYWSGYLEGFEMKTSVPSYGKTGAGEAYQVEEFVFILNETITQGLMKLANQHQVTLNTLLQTVWGILLGRYNNVDDVVSGMVISGRTADIPEIENIAGLFINTIPVRIKLNNRRVFSDLLKEVQSAIILSEKYGYFSLREIHSMTGQKFGLFDHIIAFENYPLEKEMKGAFDGYNSFGFVLQDIKFIEQSNYNLNVIIIPGKELTFRVNFNALVYDKDIMKMIQDHLLMIIQKILDEPQIEIDNLEIIKEDEKRCVLYEFNNTSMEYPHQKTIQELFEEQVEKTPDNIAISFEDYSLTFKELNGKANQFARRLREKGIQRDNTVAIMLDRSFNLIIAIIAVLKAGGAYLPIDPEYPEERIKYMLSDSNVNILITQNSYIEKRKYTGACLNIETEELRQYGRDNLVNINKSADMAYIIYTSGSTGNPKGVMIEHKGIGSLKVFFTDVLKISRDDRVLQFASISFDASVWEIFMSLLTGASLYLLVKEIISDYINFEQFLNNNRITVATLPPNYAIYLNPENILHLRKLITAGSASNWDLIERWGEKVEYINAYGPTETTICATVWVYNSKNKGDYNTVSIGRPIANTQVYILGRNNLPQPVGGIGELCISGAGLARGYINKAEFTRDKFIDNPFSKGQKLYKTGDVARWLPDGNIEFLGRLDHQVKINGYRIELGEIESHLLKYENIKDAVVLIKEGKNKDKYLYAYYVSDVKLSDREIKEFLAKKIPQYMMPYGFIRLEKMPLTTNGKIALKLLPDPDENHTDHKRVSPTNNIEETLVKIWQEVLSVDEIGINDNFFSLGGNSISIMRILTKTHSLNWNLTIQDFYDYQTIEEISVKVKGIYKNNYNLKINETDTMNRAFLINEKQIEINDEKSIFQNIFLTGPTGFLGIHILSELIEGTQANIYCLIRGVNQKTAENRLIETLNYYHNKYDNLIGKRIFVVNGDITLEKFGLHENSFNDLGKKIDLIIHTAALVKHYGNYLDFEKVNVIGTKEVIDFALKYKIQVGYISTVSVSGDYVVRQKESGLTFTENDLYIGQNVFEQVYVRSKFEAENLIMERMNSGLKATIFRVGNLSERYSDGVFQKNIEDNAFHNILKSLIEVRIIPDKVLEEDFEFTPVDYCSKAVVGLLHIKGSLGKVYHLFNHKRIKLKKIFINVFKNLGIEMSILNNCTFNDYIETISQYNNNQRAIEILISEFNFEKLFDGKYRVNIDCDRTNQYLKVIGFDWPDIDEEYIGKIAKNLLSTRV